MTNEENIDEIVENMEDKTLEVSSLNSGEFLKVRMNTKQLEEIEKYLHELDLLEKPLAIICHPSKEQELQDALGNNYLYYSHWIVPKDKILVVDRKEIENGYLEGLDNDFR